MSWETWIQDVGSSVINKATEAKFVQPYEISKLRIQALGNLGLYEEGQAGRAAPVVASGGGLFGLSQQATFLLIGGGLLAYLMSQD